MVRSTCAGAVENHRHLASVESRLGAHPRLFDLRLVRHVPSPLVHLLRDQNAVGARRGCCRDSDRGQRRRHGHVLASSGSSLAVYNTRQCRSARAVHARTFALCESLNYREWSGYYAVSAYEAHHEHEYNAIRNAAGADRRLAAVQVPVSGRDAVEAGRSCHHPRRVRSSPSGRSTTRRGATSTAR